VTVKDDHYVRYLQEHIVLGWGRVVNPATKMRLFYFEDIGIGYMLVTSPFEPGRVSAMRFTNTLAGENDPYRMD
ncbi:MAG: hypothetical protein AAF639_29160, partial [Chloroflexota bacterium]